VPPYMGINTDPTSTPGPPPSGSPTFLPM
jgi:hypothetical protein